MCKSVSSSSVHGTDMSLHRRLDEQTVLVTAVIVVVNKEQFLLRTVPSFMLLLPFSHFSHILQQIVLHFCLIIHLIINRRIFRIVCWTSAAISASSATSGWISVNT